MEVGGYSLGMRKVNWVLESLRLSLLSSLLDNDILSDVLIVIIVDGVVRIEEIILGNILSSHETIWKKIALEPLLLLELRELRSAGEILVEARELSLEWFFLRYVDILHLVELANCFLGLVQIGVGCDELRLITPLEVAPLHLNWNSKNQWVNYWLLTLLLLFRYEDFVNSLK